MGTYDGLCMVPRRTAAPGVVLAISAALAGACGARPPETPKPRTIHIPEDFASLSEAIAANPHGATIEIAPGTFPAAPGTGTLASGTILLPADGIDVQSEHLEYMIRGSGIHQTKIRTDALRPQNALPFLPGESMALFFGVHVTLQLQDLTLEAPWCPPRGPCPKFYCVGLIEAELSLTHVRCGGLIAVRESRIDIRDSSLSGLKAINSSAMLSKIDIGLAPDESASFAVISVKAASDASNDENANFAVTSKADGGVSNTVIRDSLFRDGSNLLLGLTSPAKHTAVIERSMFLKGSGGIVDLNGNCDMDITIDHAVFYRTGEGWPYDVSGIRLNDCNHVAIQNSMFVENRGTAIRMRHNASRVFEDDNRLGTSHNLAWKNAGDNYVGWTEQPFGQSPKEASDDRVTFLKADPMFVNPAAEDFHVKPGSPALRAASDGTDLGSVVPEFAHSGEQSAELKAAGPTPVGPAERQRRGRKLALVIGVQDYNAPIRRLKYARNDAEAITAELRGAGYEVTLLTDTTRPPASVPEVRKALIALTHAGIDDSVVMYFSVHGSGEANPFSKGRGFLLVADARQDSIASTALPLQDIENTVDNLSSERVVLILDACFSGAASTIGVKSITPRAATKGEGQDITGTLVAGKGKIGLYSSRDNEASLESDEFKHGYFTYFLLDAWKHGMRSTHDVYDHVQREVVRTTHGQQHPRYSSEQAEGEVPTF